MEHLNKVKNKVSELIENGTIKNDPVFICFRGSVSHGLYEEDALDDIDLLSVYVAPIEHYLGFSNNKHNKGHDTWHENIDVVNYELRHFTELLAGMNPNVLNTLHLPEKMVIKDNGLVGYYRVNSHVFYDMKEIYNSYKGYAHGQYDRLNKEKRNFAEIEELEKLDEKRCNQGLTDKEQKKFDKLSEKYYSGWMGKKRKQKVLEYGYDPKWAVHCLRLLRNGIELITEREMNVDRTGIDRQFLMKVKRGEFDFDELCEMIENEFKYVEHYFDRCYDESETIDMDVVEQMLMKNLKDHFGLSF